MNRRAMFLRSLRDPLRKGSEFCVLDIPALRSLRNLRNLRNLSALSALSALSNFRILRNLSTLSSLSSLRSLSPSGWNPTGYMHLTRRLARWWRRLLVFDRKCPGIRRRLCCRTNR